MQLLLNELIDVSSKEDFVISYVSNGVGILIINNPPLNVLNSKVFRQLDDKFTLLQKKDEVHSILITGSGEKAFVAGADIKEFPTWLDISQEELKTITTYTHELLKRIEDSPKITIAYLNGFTFGGGLELALSCDFRIAEKGIKMGLPEVRLGIIPGAGGTQRLEKLIGLSKAKEWILTGDEYDSESAYNLGLVNYLYDKGEGLSKAYDFAKRMALGPSSTLAILKECIHFASNKEIDKGIDFETEKFVQVFQTLNAREGVQAFIEKRKADFK